MNRTASPAGTLSYSHNVALKNAPGVACNEDGMLATEQDSESAQTDSRAFQYYLQPYQLSVVLWALQCFKWVPRKQEFVQALGPSLAEIPLMH
jgi:hypothetical protein